MQRGRIAAFAIAAIAAACQREEAAPVLGYVGSAECARCHADQAAAWRGSDHALAMQDAAPASVLGDFSGVQLTDHGVTSTFTQRDGRYVVVTDGPDGALREYAVRYAFGIDPLQQYLVELDRGRVQALPFAWDTRPKQEGGQRWFHLHPDENVDFRDVLHWTRRSQNWNHMCADCHTVGFAKRYDPATRSYASRFAEMGVGCEACHGPGSRHAASHGSQPLPVKLDERRDITWSRNAPTGQPRRSAPRATTTELDTCARCHARRSQLIEEAPRGQPLSDAYLPALLEDGLYEVDGQIRGEVYEYGSFVQSRMYHAGVTCGDCHEPHAARLRAPGDAVCAQCHAKERYAVRAHHFHPPDSAGARCASCHMPSRVYMGVDTRRDHGFRVPQPAQSVAFGAPNACNDCHSDQMPSWAAARVREWYGRDPSGFQGYASALSAARARAADAEPLLLALLGDRNQPAIARATAAVALVDLPSRAGIEALATAQNDANPLVRSAALQGLAALPPGARWPIAAERLRDPVRAVRIAAVVLLADSIEIPSSQRNLWDAAVADYLAAQRQNADQPEAHVNLGGFHAARGDAAAAERAYRDALALDPDWIRTYLNLADLLRALDRDGDGEALLRAGLARAPGAAALHHSLGLLRVRARDLPAALESLRRASELAPADPRYAYVYAVALHDTGRIEEAIRVTDAALGRMPADRTLREWRAQLAAMPSSAPTR